VGPPGSSEDSSRRSEAGSSYEFCAAQFRNQRNGTSQIQRIAPGYNYLAHRTAKENSTKIAARDIIQGQLTLAHTGRFKDHSSRPHEDNTNGRSHSDEALESLVKRFQF